MKTSPQMAQMSADNRDKTNDDPQTYAIIGAAMAVHGELGNRFLERIYQEALEIELEVRQIPFRIEAPIAIQYRGRTLDASYRADFICYDEIIIELKALTKLMDAHLEQVIHYLKSTGMKRALLLNFGSSKLEYRRVVSDY